MSRESGPAQARRQAAAHWLRLIRTPNVGPSSFRDLINRFGSAEAALEMLPELMLSGGLGRSVRIPSLAEAEAGTGAGRARRRAPGRHRRARISAGSQADGECAADAFDQGRAGGIFAAAGRHRGCPQRIACRGQDGADAGGIARRRGICGGVGAGARHRHGRAPGRAFDRHDRRLRGRACSAPTRPTMPGSPTRSPARGGALVSEMPFGWEPRAQDFPRRNRIIAGLSLGLVVVEAALRSGSLISARLATEMGRLVFAVPGSPLDPRAAGCNALLKEGATLVTEWDDVVECDKAAVGQAGVAAGRLRGAARFRLHPAGRRSRARARRRSARPHAGQRRRTDPPHRPACPPRCS